MGQQKAKGDMAIVLIIRQQPPGLPFAPTFWRVHHFGASTSKYRIRQQIPCLNIIAGLSASLSNP